MSEQWGAGNGGGQDGGVAQGRDFITEIGAGDDGSCYPAGGESLDFTNTHKSNAYSSDGSIGTADNYRDYSTDQTARAEEEVGMEGLHTVVDHGGHHATDHPAARQGADKEEHEQGAAYAEDVLTHGFLDSIPFYSAEGHSQQCRYSRGGKKYNLTATI